MIRLIICCVAFAGGLAFIIHNGTLQGKFDKKIADKIEHVRSRMLVDTDGQCYKVWDYTHHSVPIGVTKEECS